MGIIDRKTHEVIYSDTYTKEQKQQAAEMMARAMVAASLPLIRQTVEKWKEQAGA